MCNPANCDLRTEELTEIMVLLLNQINRQSLSNSTTRFKDILSDTGATKQFGGGNFPPSATLWKGFVRAVVRGINKDCDCEDAWPVPTAKWLDMTPESLARTLTN